jgi:hypothetical protein
MPVAPFLLVASRSERPAEIAENLLTGGLFFAAEYATSGAAAGMAVLTTLAGRR